MLTIACQPITTESRSNLRFSRSAMNSLVLCTCTKCINNATTDPSSGLLVNGAYLSRQLSDRHRKADIHQKNLLNAPMQRPQEDVSARRPKEGAPIIESSSSRSASQQHSSQMPIVTDSSFLYCICYCWHSRVSCSNNFRNR
jgi:hypothetical protein